MRTQLRENIFLIPGRRGGHYPHCNSLLIDAGERALIDPGSDRKELRALAAEGVGEVWLTHSHSDHLRDLKEFLPGAKAWVHPSEKAMVEQVDAMNQFVIFPDETLDPVFLTRKQNEVGGWGWPVHDVFHDGHVFDLGGIKVQVIHAPGHTIGHCAFWFPEHQLLYSGDVDFSGFGPWYGNSCSNVGMFLDAIERLSKLGAETTVTGHEAGVIEGDLTERCHAYAAVIHQRHQNILAFLTEPRTLEQIVPNAFIYGQYYSPKNLTHWQETRMIRQHLAYAVQQGEAALEDGRFGRT